MTALRHRGPKRLRAQSGFTLIEMVAATAVSFIVLFALSSIMIVSLHQSQRTFTKVDATRHARTAMASVENELHSACVAGGATGDAPIQTGADANNLIFITFVGTSASPTPVWHQLSYHPGTGTSGTVTDTTYAVAGTTPNWTRATTPAPTTTTLLTNVAQVGTTPVFRYYAYTPYTDASGNIFQIIPDGTNPPPGAPAATPPNNPLDTSAGLSAANADSAVEVVINLLVGASSQNLNNPSLHNLDDAVSDTISLRFTTPPDYTPAGASPQGYGPCQ
jgi:prepilin-type N-terminal cleavage/methylation domain-containing protein